MNYSLVHITNFLYKIVVAEEWNPCTQSDSTAVELHSFRVSPTKPALTPS